MNPARSTPREAFRLASRTALVVGVVSVLGLICGCGRRPDAPRVPAIPLPTEAPASPCSLFRAAGIELCLPASLGHGLRATVVPHRVVVVDGYPLAGPDGDAGGGAPRVSIALPAVAVVPLSEATRAGSPLAPFVEWLGAAVKRRPPLSGPIGLAGGGRLTGFWGAPGAPFLAHPAYLGLEWGASGLRAVTSTKEGDSGLPGAALSYLFAGVTADGQWLVLASFPVSAPVPARAGGAGDPEAEWRLLEALEEGRYAPPLEALDDVVRSIRIEASASTRSSSVVSDEGSR